ncbi:MAG: hypothetical protein U1F18_15730 [Steroidobacteraceae bacterium]
MFRWIGILVALLLVAWLAAKQMDTAGSGASKAAAEAARTAGVEPVQIDEHAPPSKVAEQVGAQVDAMVQAGKARVDEAESAAQ